MKKQLFLFGLLTFAALSCKKDEPTPTDENPPVAGTSSQFFGMTIGFSQDFGQVKFYKNGVWVAQQTLNVGLGNEVSFSLYNDSTYQVLFFCGGPDTLYNGEIYLEGGTTFHEVTGNTVGSCFITTSNNQYGIPVRYFNP